MSKVKWKSIGVVVGIIAIGVIGMSFLGNSKPTSQKRDKKQ